MNEFTTRQIVLMSCTLELSIIKPPPLRDPKTTIELKELKEKFDHELALREIDEHGEH